MKLEEDSGSDWTRRENWAFCELNLSFLPSLPPLLVSSGLFPLTHAPSTLFDPQEPTSPNPSSPHLQPRLEAPSYKISSLLHHLHHLQQPLPQLLPPTSPPFPTPPQNMQDSTSSSSLSSLPRNRAHPRKPGISRTEPLQSRRDRLD